MLSYQRPGQHFTVDENFQRVEGHKANNASFARLALYHYVTRWALSRLGSWLPGWAVAPLPACCSRCTMASVQARKDGHF